MLIGFANCDFMFLSWSQIFILFCLRVAGAVGSETPTIVCNTDSYTIMKA